MVSRERGLELHGRSCREVLTYAERAQLDARMKRERDTAPESQWWEQISGAFKNDPAFDEAMQLGCERREWPWEER